MEVSVFNLKGQDTGSKVSLPENVFALAPNDHAIYLDVKQYLANQRQGTHKSKERSELNGSTRKLHKQKGTGGSRKGDINSPLFHGGARVFGPKPRDYSFKLNKKLKQLARKSALAYKAAQNQIVVLENFVMDSHKTKGYLSFLQSFDVTNTRTLLVIADRDDNVVKASRNLAKTKVMHAADINTYEIMKAQRVFVSVNSVAKIEEILK
jgi:large subunit ribosomal protein L4